MRSRPKIAIRRLGDPPRPGGRLRLQITLESSSKTPVDAITIRFSGSEAHIPRDGLTPTEREARVPPFAPSRDARGVIHGTPSRDIVSSELTYPGRVLTPGAHAFEASFDLPADAPPSVVSATTYVEYRIHVHVSIPWWPDLSHSEAVEIFDADAPEPPATATPAERYATHDAPKPGEIFLEATVSPTVVAPGQTIRGAFSVAFPGRKPPSAIALSASVLEASRVFPLLAKCLAEKTVTQRCAAPVEGHTEAFEIALPATFPVDLETPFVEVSTVVHVVAVNAFASDVVLAVPLRVRRSAPTPPADEALPLLGDARRAKAWEEVAADLRARGIRVAVCDGEKETLAGTFRGLGFVLDAERDPRGERRLRFVIDAFHVAAATRAAFVAALQAADAAHTGGSEDRTDLAVNDGACRGSVADPLESKDAIAGLALRVVRLAHAITDAIDAMPPVRDPASIPVISALRQADGAIFRRGDLALSNLFVDGVEVGLRSSGPDAFVAWVAAPPLGDEIVARIGDAVSRPAIYRAGRIDIACDDEDPRPMWAATVRAIHAATGAPPRSPYR